MADGSRIGLAILPGLRDGRRHGLQFVIHGQLAQEAESPFEFASIAEATAQVILNGGWQQLKMD